jgi:hypothetical protein
MHMDFSKKARPGKQKQSKRQKEKLTRMQW